MGKRSIKPDKSYYQLKREELGLTREEAGNRMETISPERLVRLENATAVLRPEDVLEMSKGYRSPELCTHYCKYDCPIGQRYARDVQLKELPQITVEALSSLKQLEQYQDRLLEIAADGTVTMDEIHDFESINEKLQKVAEAVDNLQLWIRTTMQSK